MAGRLSRFAPTLAMALLLPLSVFSAAPPCAVQNKGFVDPNVTVVNGGLPVPDAETCQRTCAGLITCKVFTYYMNSGGCWLQGLSGTVPPLQDLPGVWSGPANCSDADLMLGVTGDASARQAYDTPIASAWVDSSTRQPSAAVQKKGDSSGHLVIPVVLLVALAAVGTVVFFGYKAFGGNQRRTRVADLEEASSPTSPCTCDQTPLVASEALAPFASPIAIVAPIIVEERSESFVLKHASAAFVQSMQSMQSTTSASEPIASRMVPREPIAAAPRPLNLFDRLDNNHDGVLTRAEFSQLATGLR